MEDRDRVRQGQGQVEEQRALAGLLGGFGPQFAAAFGGGVRFGGQERGIQVGGLRPPSGVRPSEVPSGAFRLPKSRS
jgi:hypothetical protein